MKHPDTLYTNAGRINLVSLKSTHEVPLEHITGDDSTVGGVKIGAIDENATLGTIYAYEKTKISVDGLPDHQGYNPRGGEIMIKGGMIYFDNTEVLARNYADKQGGSIEFQAQTVMLTNSTNISVDNSGIGQGGGIKICGNNGTLAETVTFLRSDLYASAIDANDDGICGNAGLVDIDTKKLSLLSAYTLDQATFQNDSIPDDIKQKLREIDQTYSTEAKLWAKVREKLNDPYDTYTEYISTSYKGSTIDTSTSGSGTGGIIAIDSIENITIEGKSEIRSNASSTGLAGSIDLNTSVLSISGAIVDGESYGGISSQTTGDGHSGSILIIADYITISQFASIKTNTTNGKGIGGNITLIADKNISLFHGGMIESTSAGQGSTGQISLRAMNGTVRISGKDTEGDASSIRSRCMGACSADSQEISIDAQRIELVHGGFIGSETYALGNGGKVSLNATEKIHFYGTDNSGYASKIYTNSDNNTVNAGRSGDIDLSAPNILLEDGAGVTASTLARGEGGNIQFTAETIRLKGANPHGENIDGVASGIFAQSESKGPQAGSAKTITVNAKKLYIESGAVISTSSLGAGDAGDIILNITEELNISGKRNIPEKKDLLQTQINYQCINELDSNLESGIFSRSLNPEPYAGKAGTITISADYDQTIRPSTPHIILDDYASISTATYGNGNAGNVTIDVEELNINNGASISSESLSTSDYFRDESEFNNKDEMNRINFRIFSVNMTPEEYLRMPGIEYIDIIAEDGDVGRVVVDDGSTKSYKYYIYDQGWVQDQSGLSKTNPDPAKLISTFDFFKSVPVSNNSKSIATCQYIEVNPEISQTNEISYDMTKGDTHNYVYGGTHWQNISQADNISEITDTLGLSTINFITISDYAISTNRTTSVQKHFKENSQWFPLQSGGKAGEITINNTNPNIEGLLSLSVTDDNHDFSRISTSTEGGGDAGTISIQMQNIQMTHGCNISSASNSTGNGGRAGDINLGKNDMPVQLLDIVNNAQVSTSTQGKGNAGNIEISSRKITLRSKGTIASSSNALGQSGNAGTITIYSDDITIIDPETTINTSTSGHGTAGDIHLHVNNLSLDNKASVSSASNSIGAGGAAGIIIIGKSIEENLDLDTKAEKPWLCSPSDRIHLNNESTISTSSAGAGKAGNVILNAKNINIHNDASISSANSSVADIIYEVETIAERDALPEKIGRDTLSEKIGMVVEVKDSDNAGTPKTYICIGDNLWEEKSSLSLNRADTMAELNALSAAKGDIAKVTDAGDGYSKNFIFNGNKWVPIESDKTIQVYVRSSISDFENDGIEPEKGDILVTDTGLFICENKTWQPTQWTSVMDERTVKDFQVSNLSDLDTYQNISIGDRANVNDTKFFIFDEQSKSDPWKEVYKAGDAGKIDIVAEDEVLLSSGGSLNTEAISSGGGQISIQGKKSLYLFSGLITASVQKGFGAGGDITTRSKSVLMNHSGIEANAVEGDGGAIFITTEQYIKSDESYVTATSERGNDGTVKIDAPKVDISKGLVVLPTNFLDATRWVKTPCALRSGESVSRLVLEGRDAVPTSLIDWQPSPPLDLSDIKKSKNKKKSSQLNRPSLLQSQNNMAMKADLPR
ncbi:MAG: hypothetical protein OMM_02638 [Candidatus Magnetoglobus multicellularis str. Araruama]|uniref:Uncharacterized protein n=1 Tax=Candidatus Magnetoglobus multicellularis str. Araruama TaxID=890399 RepID=A0A1V1P8V2_9BACT|nr:MAG: hypothetical protein OMM_02638 [Candidatus Magnetoglobus multicellularis str. Araruama]